MSGSVPVNDSGDLRVNLKQLYLDDLFSDFTIRCETKEFKVHKISLYLQSSFFKQLFRGKFKEASENNSTIQLDDDPDVLQALLLFLYNFVYPESHSEDKGGAAFAVQVYAIADKYDVKKLQDLAV